jgi:uncharacterized protein YdaU (DUF1376 family)
MEELPPDVLNFFKKQGQKGGKAAAKKLTPKQRKERAQKAAAKSAEVRGKTATRSRKQRSGVKSKSTQSQGHATDKQR